MGHGDKVRNRAFSFLPEGERLDRLMRFLRQELVRSRTAAEKEVVSAELGKTLQSLREHLKGLAVCDG